MLETLMTGLVVGESPRWHEGRLWFSNWGVAQEIVAVDPHGNSEVIAKGPKPAGFCIDWLDGDLLVTGEDKVLRLQDGDWVTHADVSHLATSLNEIVVDGRNIYVNDVGFAFGQEEFRPGTIVLVTPDGQSKTVAEEVMFPNGMVVHDRTLIVAESWAGRLTAFDIEDDGSLTNRRVWAPVGGDGICLDGDGNIWTQDFTDDASLVRRVREGGEVLDEIELDDACFACALGEGTLYLMVAQWQGIEKMGEMFQRHTGRVLTYDVRGLSSPRSTAATS